MEINFDKEIDALLRQEARGSESVSKNLTLHLDADEISAFAENALTGKTREVYIKHFAECNRCRTILSNTILLNSESATQTEDLPATVAVAAPQIAETKIPWYRKIFAAPNLAYTMGALVVLFGGFLGFIVLQNTGSRQSELTRITDTASSNQASGNYSLTNSNASVSNVPPSGMMTNTTTNSATVNANLSTSTIPVATQVEKDAPQNTSAASTAVNKSKTEENQKSVERAKASESTANPKPEDNEIPVTAELSARSAPEKPAAPTAALSPPAAKSRTVDEQADMIRRENYSPKKSVEEAKTTASRQVGGKTFNRKNGVWYDASYQGQTTTNIRRNTESYKNLDSGLRSIAENLDGAIIILWKNKAYRIQ